MASTANVDHMTAQVYKPVERPYYKNHPHLLILSRIRVSNICVSTLDKAIPLSMISVYLFTRNLKKNSFFRIMTKTIMYNQDSGVSVSKS